MCLLSYWTHDTEAKAYSQHSTTFRLPFIFLLCVQLTSFSKILSTSFLSTLKSGLALHAGHVPRPEFEAKSGFHLERRWGAGIPPPRNCGSIVSYYRKHLRAPIGEHVSTPSYKSSLHTHNLLHLIQMSSPSQEIFYMKPWRQSLWNSVCSLHYSLPTNCFSSP